MFGKNKIAALVAEFFGTFVLSLAVLSVAQSVTIPFFTSVTAGLTVGILILVIGNASGAHLNPAITLSLWAMRKIQTIQAMVFMASQFFGGLLAWKVAERLLGGEIAHVADWGLDTRVLAAEALGTLIFVFGVAAAIYNVYEGKKLATVIGGSLTLGMIVASLASNGIVNPALAIGLNSVSWAYFMGPLFGAVLGMSAYALLFSPAPAEKITKKATRR